MSLPLGLFDFFCDMFMPIQSPIHLDTQIASALHYFQLNPFHLEGLGRESVFVFPGEKDHLSFEWIEVKAVIIAPFGCSVQSFLKFLVYHCQVLANDEESAVVSEAKAYFLGNSLKYDE